MSPQKSCEMVDQVQTAITANRHQHRLEYRIIQHGAKHAASFVLDVLDHHLPSLDIAFFCCPEVLSQGCPH